MTPCIGWPATTRCPHWNHPMHGCTLPADHPPRQPHRCGCGATNPPTRNGQRP